MPKNSTDQVYRTHHRDEEFWTEEPNPGQFQKGDDPRRHKFTTAECQLGFQRALESIVTRYPHAIMRDGRHIACCFLRSRTEQVF